MPLYDVSSPDGLRFSASVRAWLLTPVIIVDARLSRVRVERPSDLFLRDGCDDIVLQLLVDTTASGDADGKPFDARAGECVIHDRSKPLRMELDEGHNITVAFRREFIEEALPCAQLHGLVLRMGMVHLLAGLLRELPKALAQSAPEPIDVAKLLRAAIAAAVHETEPLVGAGSDEAMTRRAKQYIADHLSDAIDVRSICTGLGVSRSRLYRAFHDEAGVAGYIQRLRLTRMHRALSDPQEKRSISELAHDHGYADSAHFSRSFRRSFGYSATTLRKSVAERRGLHIPQADPQRDDVPRIYASWEAERR
ncbi:helix-turn-helix domain-containing protein [Alteriqipengyuania lutimaris]|uniref:Helix-turn-helix domain-containing protein n=1 Tax=Alteriqipengyuania lutimaris TaxID=1538146 RepID=A0A395LLK8_9SPHN|nr:helix-turn-helix domain-containing protein [Alteriqipengyuania lutimaris]MBB3034851.1 AraC-like DNA-binding protein [Alteriqipengyuania lutimaris]RDS76314.1 helix-turn-helix domain-containing protein [Alteriqipengyuania lutimaris]